MEGDLEEVHDAWLEEEDLEEVHGSLVGEEDLEEEAFVVVVE